jgi:hypothetical protein
MQKEIYVVTHIHSPCHWEAEIWRTVVHDQPGKFSTLTSSQPHFNQYLAVVVCLSLHAMWETEIRRMTVPGLLEQKIWETPFQWKKAGCGIMCLSSQ